MLRDAGIVMVTKPADGTGAGGSTFYNECKNMFWPKQYGMDYCISVYNLWKCN